MSRRALVALAAALTVASHASAQNRADLEAEVKPLAARARAALRAYMQYQSSVNAADRDLSRAESGPLHVRTTPALLPDVRDAMVIARHHLETSLGSATYRVAGLQFVVRPVEFNDSSTTTHLAMVGVLARDGVERWAAPYGVTPADIAAGIERDAGNELAMETDNAFRFWMPGRLPDQRMTPQDWTYDRLLLVSETNETARACYAGDVGACQRGFAFEERQRLERAVRAGVFVERYRLPEIPIGLRPSLVAEAVEMGGSGAMERLLATSGGPTERLAAAAQAPVDAIVSAWLSQIRDARVASPVMSESIMITSMLLILGCIGMAMRSPRWR